LIDWPVEIIDISKHNFRDTITPVIAGSAVNWELQVLACTVLLSFVKARVEPPQGFVLVEVVPTFSEG
jgi:hypothetical protein